MEKEGDESRYFGSGMGPKVGSVSTSRRKIGILIKVAHLLAKLR